MKSTTGEHYVALDHIRALAALFVFAWHFTHAINGFPVPFSFVPAIFPFSVLDEGHTGVALFMVLSGYLFAKLLNGKRINYVSFLWNRCLRLLPLLFISVGLVGVQKFLQGESFASYIGVIARGLWAPTLPNGGWSITTEFHFYLVLPFLLWIIRRSKFFPLVILGMALGLRWYLHQRDGEVQYLAYWTIIGRIDQFVLGILAFHFRELVARRHIIAVAMLTVFTGFYWWFDQAGGFYFFPQYPSPSPLWIVMPTIEAFFYAVGIAWYDSSFAPNGSTGVSRLVAKLGEYSYSIYLFHFFIVFRLARFIHENIMDLSNFYLACLWALGCFILMVIPGYLSFRFIEAPFLKLRKRYVMDAENKEASRSSLTWIGLAAILVVTTLCYLNHFNNPFQFDDRHTIVENPYIRDLKNIPEYFTDAATFSSLPPNQSYRPIVSASLAFDYWLGGGLTPFYFHLSTFSLFLLQLVLIFFMARKIFSLADGADANRNNLLALIVTAIYGLHPVNAETVNYVIQRGDLQSTLGVVASMLLYAAAPKSRRFGLYLIPVVIGMFAKPPAVMFVPILFVYDLLFEREWRIGEVFTKTGSGKILKSALCCLPALIISAAFYVLQARLSPHYSTGSDETLRYIITQPFVILHYVKSFFLPTDLAIDSAMQLTDGFFKTETVVGFVFLALIVVAIIGSSRRRIDLPIAFGLSWFLIALLPTSLIPLAEVQNDHRMFFPFVGLTIAFVWWAGTKIMSNANWRPAGAAFCIGWLVLFGFWTNYRNQVWNSSENLWKEASEKCPNNGRAQMNYGFILMGKGQHEEALAIFNRAALLTPNYHSLEINLGAVLTALGRFREAEPHFQRAITLRPELAEPYLFYSRTLLRQDKAKDAENVLERALKSGVTQLDIYRTLIPIYLHDGNFNRASELLKSALATTATPDLFFYNELANSRSKLAVNHGPAGEDANAWLDYSVVLFNAHAFEQTILASDEVLKLQPDSAVALNNIAASYNELKQWDRAIEAAERALKILPDFQRAAGNLQYSRAQLAKPKAE